VTLVAPDGSVYQTLTVAFSTPGGAPGGDPGIQGASQVLAWIPVAGTYITQHTLVGRWRVEVSLDGQPIDQDAFVLTTGA
jgi:hypothetical protein